LAIAGAAARPLPCRLVPIVPVAELEACLSARRRLLGLDVGTKTVGLALSDALGMVASPLETLRRAKFARDAQTLAQLIDQHAVGGLVIGLPVAMDGTEGPRCQSVRQFAANLLAVVDRPTSFWDERLSTAAVTRMMIEEADLSRKRRGELVDKLAAAYILQGTLDHLRTLRAARP
jgi:putative Holliday junction resolvase